MTQHEKVNTKLSNMQLEKLKSVMKNQTKPTEHQDWEYFEAQFSNIFKLGFLRLFLSKLGGPIMKKHLIIMNFNSSSFCSRYGNSKRIIASVDPRTYCSGFKFIQTIGTLGAVSLENMLAGKGFICAGGRAMRQRRGVIQAVKWTIRILAGAKSRRRRMDF